MGSNNSDDPRNQLFIHFFEIVKDAVPKFFLAENVPGILSQNNAKLIKQALSKVQDKYEILKLRKLVATEFGVPTTRTRVFFLGYLKDEMNSVECLELIPENTKPVYVADALKGLPQEIDSTLASGKRRVAENRKSSRRRLWFKVVWSNP